MIILCAELEIAHHDADLGACDPEDDKDEEEETEDVDEEELTEVQTQVQQGQNKLQRLQAEKAALDALKAAETAKRTDSDSSAEEIQADPLAPRLSPAAVIARWTTYIPA